MRQPYVPSVTEVSLYVPVEGKLTHIKVGSAIVGLPTDDGHIRCYFEGNLYGQAAAFDERLTIAAGRLADRYPTVAIAYAKDDEVIRVGSARWDALLHSWVVAEITDAPALEAYVGELPAIGGSDNQRSRAAGQILSDDPQAHIALAQAQQRGLDVIQAVLDYGRRHQR